MLVTRTTKDSIQWLKTQYISFEVEAADLNCFNINTYIDLHINMYCRPSYNVFFYFFIFFIVRRPWPNFVCKGRHTSSVVLVLVLTAYILRI